MAIVSVPWVRPVLMMACRHENHSPLALPLETIELLKQSWNKIHNMDDGFDLAGFALFSR